MSSTRKDEDALTLLDAGDEESARRLMELVYDDLRSLAAAWMRRERAGHTLQPTAIVNEAYLRLVDQRRASWQNQAHFFAIAARVIRRVLVDYARARGRHKRGGDWQRVAMETVLENWSQPQIDLVALDDALETLRQLEPRHARVVELRFFGGLGVEETAHVLGVSDRTIKNDWRVARAWLHEALCPEPDVPSS